MKATSKLLGMAITLGMLMSCSFSGITGSRNVIKEKRELKENIEKVKVSTGIDLFLTQGNTNSLEVEADDNIIDILRTEVKDGELKIYFDKNVRNVKARKVYLTIPVLKSLKATSGASAKCKEGFSGENIIIKASSGSDVNILLNYKFVDCTSSSGSDVILSGKCDTLKLDASGGADLNAKELFAKIAEAEASSGSDIKTSVTEKITAESSTGADIVFYEKPTEKNISKSTGGSVIMK